MTFHIWTIFSFVSIKILIYFDGKLGLNIFAKKRKFFVLIFAVISIKKVLEQ